MRNKSIGSKEGSNVDSLAARAFDENAFEGSEVFLTMVPFAIQPKADPSAPPQVCLFEVNFLRSALDKPAWAKLVGRLSKPVNSFGFNADDMASFMLRIQEIQDSAIKKETRIKERREAAAEVFRSIMVGFGLPGDTNTCNPFEPQGRASGIAGAIERARQIFERPRKENKAIFGPEASLFARAVDETTIEALHSGEYLLILDRVKRLSLDHDLLHFSNREPCYLEDFDVAKFEPKLREIAEAFSPARKP
jgi:hypothetical protein